MAKPLVITTKWSAKASPADAETSLIYFQMMEEIDRVLDAAGDRLDRVTGYDKLATDEQFLKDGMHTEEYMRSVKDRTAQAAALAEKTNNPDARIEWKEDSGSTGCTQYTELAARCATAALIDAVRITLATRRPSFVLARPPTHHAIGDAAKARLNTPPNTPWGFCHVAGIATALANNIAPTGGRLRAVVLDWDVHPGNGTEDTFWEDGEVLHVNLFQDQIWPNQNGGGHGVAAHVGAGAGRGANRNFPLLKGSGVAEYMICLEMYVLPLIKEFRPDVIVVAAGFDALGGDMLGEMNLNPAWYGWATARLLETRIPVVLNLEGGYNPKQSAAAVGCCLEALQGVASRSFLPRVFAGAEKLLAVSTAWEEQEAAVAKL